MHRTLHLTNPLQHGDDVRRLQVSLKAHGYTVSTDGVFGPHTAAAVKRAKWDLGYPSAEVLPFAGAKLMLLLTGANSLPSDYKARRFERHHHTKTADEKLRELRARIVAEARYFIAHEPSVHYGQVRPIPHTKHLPLTMDCSGFVTLCYQLAGAPDPNRNGYNGQGYTGTLLAHGRPITLAQAKPADLVIWGVYPGHHVALVLEAGSDPLLASHGQEKGPFSTYFRTESAFQPHAYSVRSYL